jgi:VanZ family protein
MMNILGRSVWRSLFLLTWVAISTLALLPKPPAGADLGWDKANHLAAFGVLTLLAHWGWPRLRWTALWAGLLSYGVLIEVAQSFTPNRSAEAVDVLADAIGIGLAQLLLALAACICQRWQRWQQPR